MIYVYKNSKIFYRYIDRNTEVVNVYLHGWSADYKSLFFCQSELKSSSLFIDFPPFGKSDKGICGWTIFSYATMVVSLCEHLNIRKINLIGHSFGGRVAILVSVFCKTRVNKLVLVDSAGLKPKRKLSYHLKRVSYKLRKKLKMNVEKFGSSDYKALPPNMKRTFINIVKTYLDDYLEGVEARTLIIFGENDKETPVYMAKRFKKKIKNSKLFIMENAGHFCFLDNKYIFIKTLKIFLEKEEE